MKLKIGSPVSGDNFYPRKRVIRRLRRALDRDHISFLAPRRTGKTSVLIHLEETAPPDHPHVRVNLEKCTQPVEMIAALLLPFQSKTDRWKAAFGKGWDKIETVSIGSVDVSRKAAQKNWQPAAENLLKALLEHGGKFTFLLDEFPILVDAAAKQDRAGCESMLRWFREWRQQTADTDVRFLVTGSIGLDSVVRRHGFADTVNDFDSITLPPLSEEEVPDFVTRLGEGTGLPLNATHADHMVHLLGTAWPYFIQIFVAGIEEELPDDVRDASAISEEFLDRVYRERLIAGPKNKYLPHMWDRLSKVYTEKELRVARAVLRAVARSDDDGIDQERVIDAATSALSQSERLDEMEFQLVLEGLEHDGYLLQETEGTQRIRFFTNVLRDYWRRRHA